MKSRILAIFLTTAVVAAMLAGCGSTSGTTANAGEMNIICWSEYIPDDVVQSFEKETGIKVNETLYTSQDEMLAKVQSSAKDTFDVIMDGSQYYKPLLDKGLIEEIDKTKLKNYGNLNENYIPTKEDPDGKYGVPYLGADLVICYNTDTVKGDITGYNDLLDPAYKDSIVTIEDPRAVVGIALMATGHDINDTSEGGLADAATYLSKLKPNIHAFNGDSPKTLMINGECSVGLIYGAEAALAMDANPKIKGVYPKEGLYFGFDRLSISKEGKNKDNAYKFIDYLLDAQVSAQISKEFPYLNPNKAALKYLDDSFLNNPIKNMPDNIIKTASTLTDIGDAQSKVVDVWNKFKEN